MDTNQQLLQEAKDLLEQIKRVSSDSATKMDELLGKLEKIEQDNQVEQTKIDQEIEQVADEMDGATIDFVEKITQEQL